MSSEWEKFRNTLKAPTTKEAMEQAAIALKSHLDEQKRKGVGLGSKTGSPVLCVLAGDTNTIPKRYPSAIKVSKMPDELAKNPEFFKLMRKVIK